jgi:hypothetical protein
MITDQIKITRITYKREGTTYVAVEKGHLTRDSVIMALLKRKIGKHAYVRHEHAVR